MLRIKGDNIEAIVDKTTRNAGDAVKRSNEEVQRALIEQNEHVSFDPMHPRSILRKKGQRGWVIGSTHGNYGDILTADDEELADIIVDDILEDFP
jgi:hypothetical protein